MQILTYSLPPSKISVKQLINIFTRGFPMSREIKEMAEKKDQSGGLQDDPAEFRTINPTVKPAENLEAPTVTDELANRILSRAQMLTGDDEELYTHFINAVKIGLRYPQKQFTTTLYRHNDLEGKYNILATSKQFDIPVMAEYPSGQYKLVLKYYDPNQPVKGSTTKRGAIKTVWRIIHNQIGLNAPSLPPAGGEGASGDEIPTTPLKALRDDFKGVSGLVSDVSALMSETVKLQLEALLNKSEIEKEAYERGVREGKLQAEMEQLKAQVLLMQSAPQTDPAGGLMGLIQSLKSGGVDLAELAKILQEKL